MKKFNVMAALLAALVLLFAGCGDGSDSDPSPGGGGWEASNWYVTDTDGGTAAANNVVNLTGTGDKYVYIYFDAPGNTSYTNIVLNFTLSPGQNISRQCAYTTAGTWGQNDYIDWMEEGPISIDPTVFGQSWGATGTAIDKAAITGLCLVVNLSANAAFTLTGVKFE